MLSKMIVGLVPVWKDLSINLWVIAALNPDLFDSFFPFLVESQVVLIWQNGNFFQDYYFVCLQPIPPPLPSKTPPPPPPKTTRKQASIDSGIVQWTKTLTVGPNNTLTTQQKQHHPPPTPHIPCSLSQLDKMNTSLQPAPSYHHFFIFLFFSPSILFWLFDFFVWSWCSLQQGACCTDE